MTEKEPIYPPTDGTLFVPEVLDFHMQHNPNVSAYVFSEDESRETVQISFLEAGRACHRIAHILRPVGAIPAITGRPVVGLLALCDTLLYQLLNVGMMRADMIPFPISHRNSAIGVVSMLVKTSCHRLLVTGTNLKSLIDEIEGELHSKHPDFHLLVEEIPNFDDVFPSLGCEVLSDPFVPYPKPLVRPSRDDTVIYLHSSGSTGPPKPVAEPHRVITSWGALPVSTSLRDHTPRIRVAAMHLPPFHGLGFSAHVVSLFYACRTVALYPPIARGAGTQPVQPTPDNILEHVKRTQANLLWAAPSLLTIWAQDSKAMDVLKKLECVLYGGGALAPKLCKQITGAGVNLCSGYGATEYGTPIVIFKRPEDRHDTDYVEFWEGVDIRWAPQGDGTFECQILATSRLELAMENLPDTRGYATSDIFERHPTKEHLWRIVGRIDDVIIHSSGEKTVPMMYENLVMTSPYVMGAVMFGHAHSQPGILVEPSPQYIFDVDDEQQLAEFRNLVWPIIEEANLIVPTFSRIFKEMILPVRQCKPLHRAGKGTIMRKLSLQTYHDEIEVLYATVESTQISTGQSAPASWDLSGVRQWLTNQANDLGLEKDIKVDKDFFEQGFDSLTVTILRRRIVGALQASSEDRIREAVQSMKQNTLYNYPTIDALASFLTNLTKGNHAKTVPVDNRTIEIEKMISKYTLDRTKDLVVLLTGSTGNLGSYLLEALLKDSTVSRVYALNRPAGDKSLLDRQIEQFRDKGLDAGVLKLSKLRLVECDLSETRLSIPVELYHELRTSVTTVIHNAWRLDFNLTLPSFETNIRGTRNLIDLALASPNHATIKFLFVSSIGTTLSWDQARGPYPEEIVLEPKYAVGTGYGESKYVTERLLAQSGLQGTSLRLGQISGGSPRGAWSTTDWVPIIVKSSLAIGALPTAMGLASWIPTDDVNSIILDLVFTPNPLPQALNIVHPNPLQWDDLFKYIERALYEELELPSRLSFIPMREWVQKLEGQQGDEASMPALRLIDFFRRLGENDMKLDKRSRFTVEAGGLAKLSLTKITKLSHTMRTMEPLSFTDAQRWVRYWKGVGYLSCPGRSLEKN